MNVGVYFPGFPQEAGGAFTFEQDLLTSLEAIAGESHHKFTLFFGNNSLLTEELDKENPGKLKRVFLEKQINEGPARFARPTLLAGLKTAIKRKVNNKNCITSETTHEKVEDPNGLFLKACEEEDIEFIWFPTTIFRADDLVYIATSWDIPYIATVLDVQHRLQPWFPEVSQSGTWAYREFYYATYLRRATYIITPNRVGMEEISFFYQISLKRIRPLPHPTPNISTFPSNEKIDAVMQKYGISKGFLFYPAQFWAHKNHANLLLALQLLRDKFNLSLHLVLTGSNQGNMDYIRELTCRLNLDDQVHFLGFVPREDLIALYRGAFVLTYISLFGPENMPPLEAFASGCPVIASNIAGAQEQLGDAALLVNGTSPDEIAHAIKNLYENLHLRDSLIQKGIDRKDFTSMDFIREVFGMLDEFEPIRRNWKK